VSIWPAVSLAAVASERHCVDAALMENGRPAGESIIAASWGTVAAPGVAVTMASWKSPDPPRS
jgi:hypothetical protein